MRPTDSDKHVRQRLKGPAQAEQRECRPSGRDGRVGRTPTLYRDGYATPLLANLPTVLLEDRRQAQQGGPSGTVIEQFAAAVYEHVPAPGTTDVRVPLQRFLAVVSNFYRSFLDRAKRAAADVPLVTDTPPLAFFQTDGTSGPYTITSETVEGEIGSKIGIVSLPATYRDHPITWASLAHETGGHDVVHADAGLLGELVEGVRAVFGGGPLASGSTLSTPQLHGLL